MKYLYILTPAVPRHDCHLASIIPDVKILHSLKLFDNIEWYVNIDNPTSSTFKFEDRRITEQIISQVELENVNIEVTLPEHPCFYTAFSTLLAKMKNHITKNEVREDEFCFLWLEDDWIFTKQEQLNRDLVEFMYNKDLEYYTLYRNKVNIGGNPQFIKGTIFMKYFMNLDISLNNKRDPEVIMRNEIFRDYIWQHSSWTKVGLEEHIINDPTKTFKDKLIIVNSRQSKLTDTTVVSNGMFGDVIKDIGDDWRDARGFVKWNIIQKEHGIKPEENYTYN